MSERELWKGVSAQTLRKGVIFWRKKSEIRVLLSFPGDKHENKHSLKCSCRVFSFATIRGLRVYFTTIWGICHWEKNGLILLWLDPRGSLNGVPPQDSCWLTEWEWPHSYLRRPWKTKKFLFQSPNFDHPNWAKINTSLCCSNFAAVDHAVHSLWVGWCLFIKSRYFAINVTQIH